MSGARRSRRRPYCECHASQEEHIDAAIEAIVDRAPELRKDQKATLYAVFRLARNGR